MHPAAGALAGACRYGLGDFAELFAGVGVNLPQATRLLMEHQQPAWNILRSALLHQLAWLLGRAMLGECGTPIGLLWAAALSRLLVVPPIAALYLPLLTLGNHRRCQRGDECPLPLPGSGYAGWSMKDLAQGRLRQPGR